jgi:hypothetical protein
MYIYQKLKLYRKYFIYAVGNSHVNLLSKEMNK